MPQAISNSRVVAAASERGVAAHKMQSFMPLSMFIPSPLHPIVNTTKILYKLTADLALHTTIKAWPVTTVSKIGYNAT